MIIDIGTRSALTRVFQNLSQEQQAAARGLEQTAAQTRLAYAGMMSNIAERFANKEADGNDILAFLASCSAVLKEHAAAGDKTAEGLQKNVDGSARAVR